MTVRKRRSRWIVAALAVLVLVVLGIAFRLALPALLERALAATARAYGVEARAEVQSVGWRRAELADLQTDLAGLRVARTEVRYSVLDLLRRRVDAVELTGVVVETPLGPLQARLVIELDGNDVRVRDGEVELPELRAGALGIAIDAEWAMGDAGPSALGTIRVEEIRTRDPAYAPPLALEGEFELDTERGALTGTLRDPGDVLVAEIEARHRFRESAGSASARLEPVEFAPDALQPGDLSPLFADLVENVSGTARAAAGARWSDGKLRYEIDLLLDRVSLEAQGLRVRGVDGDLHYAHPRERRLGLAQRIAFERGEGVVAVSDVVLRFAPSQSGLHMDEIRFGLFGGTVEGSGDYDAASGETRLDLRAVDLDLGALLAQLQIDGLTGTGKLAGEIPVRVGGNHLWIEGGRLASGPEGGTIRYQPAVSPKGGDPALDLVIDIVENFRYESLAAGLNGDLRDELVVALRLVGENPDLGTPVDLTVTLSEHLGAVFEGLGIVGGIRDAFEARVRAGE
ncbi:MAG: YdbH domain-containing protein [Proteobacteria bacterium]|nr:YdbH domain-containing protein [Pseudomonadota bacterium]